MKTYQIKIIIKAALAILLLCACSGLPPVKSFGGLGLPSDHVPFMENTITGTLPSGLRYFILENSMPENRAYLTLAVKAGSINEEDDEQGLAHFVEHMAFKGTERFPEAELVNYLRSLGMRFGPEVNAYTSFDRTVYGIEVPVENGDDGVKRLPDKALAIIDDWSRAVTFKPEDVDSERSVIIEEYRTRLGARERISRQWLPVLFRGSPYAERWPIGLPEIIEEAPASRLEGFYRKWYKADNMALIFVGDFDGAALQASLEDHFLIEKPAVTTVRPVYDLPLPVKGNIEYFIATDPELTSTSVNLYFKRSPETGKGTLEHYRSEIIDSLIERMMDMRFEEECLKPDAPFVSAGSGTAQYAASSRFYIMAGRPKTGMAEESLLALLREKEKMLRFGFTRAELKLAADSLVSDMLHLVMEKDKLESESYLNSLVYHFIDNDNFADIEWETDAIMRMLPHIKIKDINAAVKDYFFYDDILVYISAPDTEKPNLPDEERIKKLILDSRKMKIARSKASTVEEGFVSSLFERGSVTKESVDEETGALIWELSNGAKVILKETNNKNDEIIMHSTALGGTTSVSPQYYISAELAVEMMQVSGLGPWSRSELSRKLAGKQVQMSYSISSYLRTFTGFSTNNDLKTFFESLYLNFTEPRIDPASVEVMMDSYRTSLALRDENPRTVFSDEIRKIIFDNHPYYKPLELEDLSKVDINVALNFLHKSLNPADFTFVFTGNLDKTAMKNYIETYLASIPAGGFTGENWNTWTDLEIKRPGKIEKNVYKGKEEQSSVYMAWFEKTPFIEELSIRAQVLEEYLDIILNDEIREKLGGVYSIGQSVSASNIPNGELSMRLSFSCDPKRVQELSDAVIRVFQQVAAGVIDQDVFDKSIEALKKGWEVNMQSNSYIAQSYINSSVLLNLPLSRLNRRPGYFEAVTKADIQSICARLLQNGPAKVVLFPEE